MRRVLSSHRRRRNVLWWGGLLALASLTAAIFVLYPNTSSIKAPQPSGRQATSSAPKEIERTQVPLTADAREAALRTAAGFVKTAVLRRHVDASWRLTAPALRHGYSRSEWSSGDIPVVPFPAASLRQARWRVGYSYRNEVGFDVLLLPKAGSHLRPAVFSIALRAFGGRLRKRWLVESWSPLGAPVPGSPIGPSSRPVKVQSPLSPVWLLAPVGLVLVLLIVPLAVLVRECRAGRRAERAYRERTALPELPSYRPGSR